MEAVTGTSMISAARCGAGTVGKPYGEIGENGPKWVQNGRQILRIDPQACRGHFLASGTGPAAQNRHNISLSPDQLPPAAAMFNSVDDRGIQIEAARRLAM